MFIQTEATPNPSTLKFIPGRDVMPGGTLDIRDPEMAARSPLARRLFDVQGVNGVFFGSDFVSVTKSDLSPSEPQKRPCANGRSAETQ